MNINLETLSSNIKFLRIKYGISQEELAHTIHLARSTYSTYETGAKVPDLQTIDALAALYNIGFDSLVNYDLSDGLVHRIYFDQKDEDLIGLLNDYLNLSIASRNIIAENLKMMLEWELLLYQAYAKGKALPESSRALPENSRAALENSKALPENSRAALESSKALPESSRAALESSREPLHEQLCDKIDGDGNSCNRRNGA